MNKLNLMILILPLFVNMIIIILLMMPSKINKFHPISLMIILIITTILISLKMNFLQKSIMPFILFLIMIGGLMVIFMYITSLANNEFFIFNLKNLLINLMKIMPFMLIMLILMINFNQLIYNLSFFDSFQMMNYTQIYNNNIDSMYKELNNKSSYFIMLYLYYSMICIMNICYKLKAPLRQISF